MANNDHKETSVGLVPTDWEMVPLGDIFEPITIRLKDLDDSDRTIPILSMTRAQGLVLQSEKFDKRVASRDTSNYKVVRSGQLVYGFPIDEGVIAILHRCPIGAVSPAYQVWNPIINVDLIFLDYMLKTPFMINAYMMYSSNVVERRRNLAQRDFIRIEVPLPPLPEQHTIAHVLSTVRQSIEATEGVIASARELKRSLKKYLFTYGPVPIDQADQVPLKQTEIGEVAEHWQPVTIGKVVDLRRTTVEPSDFPDLHYVGLEHIDPGETSLKRWGQANEVKSAKARFCVGDILYGKLRPYLDKAALASFEGLCSTDILVLTPKNGILGEYIVNLLHTLPFVQHAIATTTGVNHPRTSWGAIRDFSFHIPTFEEQRSTIKIFNSLNSKVETETSRCVALEALFNSLLHHLMTGKVRVPIEPKF